MKLLFFSTHPIQYQAPIYRELAKEYDLKVVYLLHQTAEGHANAGFGVSFEWDIPLTDGYDYAYLNNKSKNPSSYSYNGIVLDVKDLMELYAKEKPDAVFVNGWFPKGMVQIAKYFKKHHIPVVCRGDSNLRMTKSRAKMFLKKYYIPQILQFYDYFLYVGNLNKEFYVYHGVVEDKLFPAAHCINTLFFEKKYAVVKKLESDQVQLGFCGKLIPRKEPLMLVEAISHSKFKSDICLNVVGDGPLKDALLSRAKELGVEVNFIGFLNQSEIVSKGYSLFDVLVLPSNQYETWGLVVNEVMTNGIPAIVSDTVGCHADLIEEGKTGYVFKSLDRKALTDRIDQYIEKRREGFDFQKFVKLKIGNYSLAETVSGYKVLINKLFESK